jgi:chromosome segregation ATPase
MAKHRNDLGHVWENSLERLEARDELRGEADSTVAALRGEAQEVRNRLEDGDDVAEQLEHRADHLEAVLERLAEASEE